MPCLTVEPFEPLLYGPASLKTPILTSYSTNSTISTYSAYSTNSSSVDSFSRDVLISAEKIGQYRPRGPSGSSVYPSSGPAERGLQRRTLGRDLLSLRAAAAATAEMASASARHQARAAESEKLVLQLTQQLAASQEARRQEEAAAATAVGGASDTIGLLVDQLREVQLLPTPSDVQVELLACQLQRWQLADTPSESQVDSITLQMQKLQLADTPPVNPIDFVTGQLQGCLLQLQVQRDSLGLGQACSGGQLDCKGLGQASLSDSQGECVDEGRGDGQGWDLEQRIGLEAQVQELQRQKAELAVKVQNRGMQAKVLSDSLTLAEEQAKVLGDNLVALQDQLKEEKVRVGRGSVWVHTCMLTRTRRARQSNKDDEPTCVLDWSREAGY
jgi:hypothetical protein